MATRILFDQFEDFPDPWKVSSYAKKRQYYTECWPVVECRTVQPGDIVYFLDRWESVRNAGIFASGEIVKTELHDQLRHQDPEYTDLAPCYCTYPWGEHEEQKARKREVLYVCFKLSATIDAPEDTLKLSKIKKLPAFENLNYRPEKTGEPFPEEYVRALTECWRNHVRDLAKRNKATILPAFRRR